MSRVTGNTISKANATISDIAEFFGMSRASKLNSICAYAGINKWARYKPVAYETLKGLTKATGHPTPLSVAELLDVSYGLTLPSASSTPAAAAAKTFGYTRPTANDWCRISDFLNAANINSEGYNHSALAPARRGGFSSAMTFPIFSYSEITRELIVAVAGSTTGLALEDLTLISGCYLAFCWTDGGTTYIKTAGSTITSGGISITLEDDDFPNVSSGSEETYTYYLCLCTTAHTSRTVASTSYSYYPLPFDSVSYATGTITVSKDWPFDTVTITFGERESMVMGYGYSQAWAGLGFVVYQRPSVQVDPNVYFRVNSNGDLYLRVELVNPTDTELVYPSSGTTAKWTATLASNSTVAGSERGCLVYASDGATSTSSVTVPAGGTGYVYVKCSNFFRYYNGNNLGTLAADTGRTGVLTLSVNGIEVVSQQLNFATPDYSGDFKI